MPVPKGHAKMPHAQRDQLNYEPVLAFPAASSLSPEEHAAKIAEHEARVAAGLVKLAVEVAKHKPPPGTVKSLKKTRTKAALPDSREWDSLRVVNCRKCRNPLLAVCDEPLRAACSRIARAHLPPPVVRQAEETHVHGGQAVAVRFCLCQKCA